MSNCINIPLSFKPKITHIEHQNQRFGHQNQRLFLSTGGPDGTAPVLLHCIWCGARMRTAGQAMCTGKWAGIASCGGHRAPHTGSVVMTKAHGVTTIAISTVYEDC